MNSILQQLNQLFEQDPLIDEVGYVLLEEPKAFELHQHKLGIASWVAQSLFQQAKELFLSAKDETQIAQATRAIVMISADNYSAWNARKQLVETGALTALDELKLTAVVFSKQPKSIDTWAYRKWLSFHVPKTKSFFASELELCQLLAELSPRNYHAWAYRQFIMHQCPLPLLSNEIRQSQEWVSTNVSDHSGWYYRIGLLRHVWTLSKEPSLSSEFQLLDSIIQRYPSHENLWCYRRFLYSKRLLFDKDKKQLEEFCTELELKWDEPQHFSFKTDVTTMNELKYAHDYSVKSSSSYPLRYMLWILRQESIRTPLTRHVSTLLTAHPESKHQAALWQQLV